MSIPSPPASSLTRNSRNSQNNLTMCGRPAGGTPCHVWVCLAQSAVTVASCRAWAVPATPAPPSPLTRPFPRKTRAGGEKKHRRTRQGSQAARGERGRRTWGGPLCARRAQGSVCGREAPAGGDGDPPETHNSCTLQHSYVVSLFRHFFTSRYSLVPFSSARHTPTHIKTYVYNSSFCRF